MADDNIPNWFLWIWEHFPAVLTSGILIAVILFAGFFFVDQRLMSIEEQLNYARPSRYQPPDLANFNSGDVTADQLTTRHSVYVPVYSHIYFQEGSAYLLETTLSIRNISPTESVFIESVEYYNTDGKLAKTYVDELIELAPLQTIEFLVERRDSSGGSGANFLVHWGAKSPVDKPLIESVMVGTAGTQGISFARNGIEISSTKE
jgi:hypothetical protein